MEADDIGDINLPAAPLLPEHDSSQINISDVIAAIQTADPISTLGMFATNPAGGGGGGEVVKDPPQHSPNPMPMHQQQQQQQQHQQSVNAVVPSNQHQQQSSGNSIRRTAYVKITEQPAGKALRFRYECEGRSAGSIPGVNSTPENRTFPSIQVVGYKGRAVVVVSCVTKDPPYRPHPHNLVGREGCRRGVCTVEINSETMSVVFSNLGIQCVKKKDIEAALKVREEIRVDPFRTGFSHRCQATGIDLNAVRLCFQVFLESEQRGRFTVPLPPVVSDPIYDKKAMSELVICKLSDCSCTVAGGKEVILLCEKVARDDISVRFFEEQDGKIRWQAYGDFQHTNVHKQVAISFRTPKYERLDVREPVKVYIQLQRPSDGATSEALPFDYLPLDSDLEVLKRKRQRIGGNPTVHLLSHLQEQQQQQNQQMMQQHPNISTADARQQPSMAFAGIMGEAIKTEPQDHSPNPYMFGNTSQYRVPQATPSPQPLSPASNYTQANTPSPLMGAARPLVSPNDQLIRDNVSPMNMNYGAGLTPYTAQYSNAGIENYRQMQQQQQQQTQQTPVPWDIPVSIPKQTYNNITNFNVDNLITNANPINSHGQGLPQQNEGLNLTEPNIPSNLSSLLDMDSQHIGYSSELSQMSFSFLYNQNNGSSSQQLECKKEEKRKMETEQENMMDSFTKLTTATMNELVDLGQMYNNQNNC